MAANINSVIPSERFCAVSNLRVLLFLFLTFGSLHASLFTASAQPRVALMLPLEGTGAVENDFTEFYRGALLGLEDVKARGGSARVTLYDTAHSPEKVYDIISSSEFWDTSLVIGPVFENELAAALPFIELMGIPVVSPLATLRGVDSPLLYQMSPDPATRYDKLRPIFGLIDRPNRLNRNQFWNSWGAGQSDETSEFAGGDKNIILLSSGPMGDDADFEREILRLLDSQDFSGQDVSYIRFTVTGERPATPRRGVEAPPTESEELGALIDWERENIFVVLGGSEVAVDNALTTISTAYNNISARSSRRAKIRVVGSSRWASWNNLDRNLFFSLGATFVTSYYVSRSDPRSTDFEKRYLKSYNSAPSRASYRGYDAVRIFVGALVEPSYDSFADRLGELTLTPLLVPYRFVRPEGSLRRVNAEWTLVEFHNDFNITVR